MLTYMSWSLRQSYTTPRSAGKEASLLTRRRQTSHPPEKIRLSSLRYSAPEVGQLLLRKVVTLTTWAELRVDSYNLF
jgi:hypothetical protein